MSDVLVYVLHYEGAFNKNSLGAVSEGAARAAEIGGEAHAVVVGGPDLTDDLCKTLGAYGAKKVFRAEGPEGLAQPVVDVMDRVISEHGHAYALFGGGLLGFEIGAGLAARKQAGVTMEVTAVKIDPTHPGKLIAERPILGDSQISVSRYQGDLGIIIGRINAFELHEVEGDAEVVDVEVEYSAFTNQAQMISRGAQGSDDDFATIVDYLATNLPPHADVKKVNVNKAAAAELASGLQITDKDASAILDYRKQNGDFKSLADLKKVPGIDAARLDSVKDRIAFE